LCVEIDLYFITHKLPALIAKHKTNRVFIGLKSRCALCLYVTSS